MTETHFKAVTPDEPIKDIRPTDWKCCFICQVDDGGASNLVSPSKKLGKYPGFTYNSPTDLRFAFLERVSVCYRKINVENSFCPIVCGCKKTVCPYASPPVPYVE